MIKPAYWEIRDVKIAINDSLGKLNRYQSKLSEYSEQTTEDERRQTGKMLLPEVNQFCLDFASGEMNEHPDSRLLHGLWIRLYFWGRAIENEPDDHYLVADLGEKYSQTILHYLLRPLDDSDASLPLTVLNEFQLKLLLGKYLS